MRMAWVDILDGVPIRIFRSEKAAYELFQHDLVRMPRAEAVGLIREQVFRSSGEECEYCGKPISLQTMHMHEKVHRGQGGEISLDNSVALCFACHAAEHKNRNPRFGEG